MGAHRIKFAYGSYSEPRALGDAPEANELAFGVSSNAMMYALAKSGDRPMRLMISSRLST